MTTMTTDQVAAHVRAAATIDGPNAALELVEAAERDAMTLRRIANQCARNAYDANQQAREAELLARAARDAYASGGAGGGAA